MLPSWPQAVQQPQALPFGVKDVTSHVRNSDNYNVDVATPGGTSDVWFCSLRTSDGEIQVAVKKLRAHNVTRKKIMERFFREVRAWYQLQNERPHDHVCELLGVVDIGKGRPGIVLPYYKNNDALSFIRNGKFDERKKGEIVLNIAQGLEHMHVRCNSVHGDLKLRNILFDNQGVPKISDFGLSRIMGIRGLFTTTTISLSTPYAAPEILEKEINDADDSDVEETCIKTKESDIYSFAILTAEIFMERNYFATRNNNVLSTYRRITEDNRRPEVNSRKYCPLLEDCWKTDPAERLRIDQIIWALRGIENHGRYYDPRRQN